MILFNIAAEDQHGTDTDREGKEGLTHGCINHITDTHLSHILEIRNQIEADAFSCTLQENRMNCQNNHKKEKG